MSSSEKNEILPQECCPAMRADLFKAAIKGNRNVLLGCITPEERNEIKVTIDASVPDTLIRSELRSATPFGDTLLHILITERHNELALTVFSKDKSLLKAHNKKLETPLHCAALLGNVEVIRGLIRLAPGVVRDALSETNGNGDTALHVAANHNHGDVVLTLMNLDPQAVYKENKQGFSPLYIAIVEGYTSMVKAMLEVDATDLACTQFFDGTFPVHVAARMGNTDLLEHFLKKYPDDATLLDSCRRNLFHISAEHNHSKVVTTISALTENDTSQIRQIVESMINAKDYEGNTPLHIAAMKGHRSVMKAIWNKLNHDRKALLRNQKGKTAFNLSEIQLGNTNEVCIN
ncbi:hypothetical protein LUZ63_009847 [Rhynchospora breviuscula]|uniref:Uncharacterized protein n=1 Tax=Rhynchospora breviuscula TaxID=2022672 RepID=A0A9Q0HP16_9POAL|nr:hypothetical protein LUZ63_009847 [Rhynchospora breviuscula]